VLVLVLGGSDLLLDGLKQQNGGEKTYWDDKRFSKSAGYVNQYYFSRLLYHPLVTRVARSYTAADDYLVAFSRYNY
jgi:hypothetical protein